jgi:hypothetical protein
MGKGDMSRTWGWIAVWFLVLLGLFLFVLYR